MVSLSEMQRSFISDCLSGKRNISDTLRTKNLDTRNISEQGLMGIYQNNAFGNITHSLALTYPVIQKLVGDDFFRAMCSEYISVTWPESGNLDDYGSDFPHFIAEFEHAKHLHYLCDVARLEWAFHQSSLAINAKTTDWSTLAQADNILTLKFILSPSVSFLSSTFPIDKIWNLNQIEQLETDNTRIELNMDEHQDETFLVLVRQHLKTAIVPITRGEFTLLNAFDKNQTFGEAIEFTSEENENFSIEEALRKFIELGIVYGFEYA
jgi:hypothetical protein